MSAACVVVAFFNFGFIRFCVLSLLCSYMESTTTTTGAPAPFYRRILTWVTSLIRRFECMSAISVCASVCVNIMSHSSKCFFFGSFDFRATPTSPIVGSPLSSTNLRHFKFCFLIRNFRTCSQNLIANVLLFSSQHLSAIKTFVFSILIANS